MTRSNFLKSFLSIPAIAMLFPASPGAVAEPKFSAVKTRTEHYPRSITEYPYLTEENAVHIDTKYGLNSTRFMMCFSEDKFKKGDIITYDREVGKQIVLESEAIQTAKNGFLYCTRLISNDPSAYVQGKYLLPGMQYTRIGELKPW